MSIFSFKKNKKSFSSAKENYSLVLSIGSGKVSGAVLRFTEKAGVDVVYHSNEAIPLQAELSISRHMELMNQTVSILAQRIQKEITNQKIAISKIFYVLSSPWCISQVKNIHIKENMPFKINEEYLNKVIDSAEKESQANFKNTKTIERKIIQIKNNGYIVDSILNQTVKDVDLAVYFTFADKTVLDGIENSLNKSFQISEIWCHSSSLAIFSNIRNIFPQKEDFIQVDMSEEMTDLSIVRSGILTDLVSIPMGRNHFVRQITSDLKVSEAVADSMIKMSSTKSNDELGNIKTAVSLNKISEEWLIKINEALVSLRVKMYITNEIFLISNGDLSTFLKEKLEKFDYNVFFVDNKKIKPNLKIENTIFRLELMFLDNIYKL